MMIGSSGVNTSLVLDAETIRVFCIDICDGNPEIVDELVGMYLKSLDDLSVQMESALHAGDYQLLRRAAHSLKSSSRVFGAELLSANCERLEEMAHTRVLDGAAELIEQIAEQGQQMHQLLPQICRTLTTER